MPEFRYVFTTADYEKMVAFYADTMGLPVVDSWEHEGGGTVLAAADGQIEILAPGKSDTAPWLAGPALAWEVADVDAEIARLRERGVTILDEPADRPWGHRNAAIRAPDGLGITLYTVIR